MQQFFKHVNKLFLCYYSVFSKFLTICTQYCSNKEYAHAPSDIYFCLIFSKNVKITAPYNVEPSSV
jgi:hypothetical protein